MIRNYTSNVPVAQSLSFIETKLSTFGAKQIVKEYAPDRSVACLYFILSINNTDVPFKLPARKAACEKLLKQEVRRPRPGTHARITAQAERTAWKLMAEWVDTQLTLIKLDQVKLFEAFLPFVYDPASRLTYYENLEQRNFKGLLPAPDSTSRSPSAPQ